MMKRPDAYLATQTDMAVAGQSSLYPDNNKVFGKQSMENILSRDRIANANNGNMIRSG